MAYYRRHIDNKLLEWKNSARRKPLLIRGARQVGKTAAVRELGKTFKNFVEINLEKQPDLIQLFPARGRTNCPCGKELKIVALFAQANNVCYNSSM